MAAQKIRELTRKQEEKLSRMEVTHPKAIVTGWIEEPGVGRGPIIEFNGDRKLLNVTGHLKNI